MGSFTRVHARCNRCGGDYCVIVPEGVSMPLVCRDCREQEAILDRVIAVAEDATRQRFGRARPGRVAQ